MKSQLITAVVVTLLAYTAAHAIDAKYREQLERSGCTQLTELQGCDITKTREENVRAGFVTLFPADNGTSEQTPYAGHWMAKTVSGQTLATIRIDEKERVWVNGKQVQAKRSDGALVFRDGKIMFTIQGDRRLQGEDIWNDFDAGTKGPILAK